MFEKYLLPIIYNFQCIGNGVLIGKYFFTAAHVIYEGAGNCMVEISGKVFQLREDNALALVAEQNEEKQLLYDFAIYEIDCLHSPFQLSQETLEAKSFLYSYSVKTLYNSSTNEVKRLQLLTNTGKVSNEKIGNILICDLSDKLSGGQSGSPVMLEKNVYGLLCGDPDGKKESRHCFYTSGAAIVEYLRNNKPEVYSLLCMKCVFALPKSWRRIEEEAKAKER